MERLLEHIVDRSGLDMISQRAQNTDYIDPIIMHAATYDHLLLLEVLRRISLKIQQANSRGFPTPLRAAVQGEQLQVTRLLIQQGTNCNTRYSDGQKPLFHAVTETSFDVVRTLVEEGGASILVIT
jgi:ankyrin repeat protein